MQQGKIDMGLALLEIQNWEKITVDKNFVIVSEKRHLKETLHSSIKSDFLEIFDPGSQSVLQGMASSAITGHVGSNILFTRDGTPLEVLLTQRENKQDIFVRNIEGRLRALEHYNIFYRDFLTTPTAICITDNNVNIVDANRSFLDLYGYRLDQVVGQNPRILKSSRQSPSVYKEMWESITNSSSGSWSGEIIDRCKNGLEKTVHLTINQVRKSNGSLIGYVSSAIDISREKRLEESLKARNEELHELEDLNNSLMAITFRDLKTALNSIVSRVSFIKETVDVVSRDKLLEQVEWIISECSRMTMHLNDYFDVGKIDSGNMGLITTRVRLDSLLRTCIDINSTFALKKNIKLSLDIKATPTPILAESSKMEQVFNRLISNAVKFSPVGSEVLVICRDSPEGKLVEIHDHGPGIPDEDLEAIFDRYFQAKKKGIIPKRALEIGLSLNIVKNIVELHGGKIKAANLPSGGCVFSVEIPVGRPVESGRDIAALIHDPSGSIFQYLEKPLRANEVSCFITKSDLEAARIFEYEKPELAFVAVESLTPELRLQFMAIREEIDCKTEFILISHDRSVLPDYLFSRVLVMPVKAMEVLAILKNLSGTPLESEAGSRVYSITIVDEDETTHEVLGEYLRTAGYEIRHAYHPAQALRLLATSRPDLILLDIHISEASGFNMLATMKGSPILRDVPVIFLSPDRPDDNAGTGGALFIAKPFIKAEVLAQVKTILQRNAATRKSENAMEGNLADVMLPELLHTMEIGQKNCIIRLYDIDGEITIAGGMFISARQGIFYGEEAFLRLFFLGRGSFSIQFSDNSPEFTDAAVSLQSLVMRGAVCLDEVGLLLADLPSNETLLGLSGEAELPAELAGIFFPCPLPELLVQMKGDMKNNAGFIAAAFKKGLLNPLERRVSSK